MRARNSLITASVTPRATSSPLSPLSIGMVSLSLSCNLVPPRRTAGGEFLLEVAAPVGSALSPRRHAEECQRSACTAPKFAVVLVVAEHAQPPTTSPKVRVRRRDPARARRRAFADAALRRPPSPPGGRRGDDELLRRGLRVHGRRGSSSSAALRFTPRPHTSMLPHCAPNATLAGPHLLVTTHAAQHRALRLDGGGQPPLHRGPRSGPRPLKDAADLLVPCPAADTNALLVGSQFLGSRRSGMSGADALLALGGGGGLLESWPAHTRYLHATEWDRTSRALVSVDALSGKLELHRAVRRGGAPSGHRPRRTPARSPPASRATARPTTSTTWRSRRRRSGRCARRCAPTTRRSSRSDAAATATSSRRLTSTAAAATSWCGVRKTSCST